MPPCRRTPRLRTLGTIRAPALFAVSEVRSMNSILLKIICLLALFSACPACAATQVDINSADAKTLAQALDGVGLVKAEAIVAYRNVHGPFESIEDVAKVKGIGPRILEENREAIVFGKSHPTGAPRSGSPHSVATW
jgi:competence protein ComEA